jgi:pyruvate,orthophosphate dikinase
MARVMPAVSAQLRDILHRLEREFHDVQDVEFTIETGRLWILQTRAAKCSPLAALRIAIGLMHEGLIAPAQALHRLANLNVDALARTRLDAPGDPAVRGIGASAGVATGRAVFDSARAAQQASAGDPVILVRPDTSAADIAGFAIAAGIVTAHGGLTAHAALVARQMGKPCVVGCRGLDVVPDVCAACFDGGTITEGDWISIDGDNGAVYLGRANVVCERPNAELAELDRWRSAAAAVETTDREGAAVAVRDRSRRHSGSRNVRHHAS